MKTVITLQRLEHQGELQIKLEFAYNIDVKDFVKRFPGVKWSQTNTCFYVLYSAKNLHDLFGYLQTGGYYVDYSAFKAVSKPKLSTPKIERPEGKQLYRELSPEHKQLLKDFTTYLHGKRMSQSTVSGYGHFILRFLAKVNL